MSDIHVLRKGGYYAEKLQFKINNLTLGALAVVLADARPTTLLQKVSAVLEMHPCISQTPPQQHSHSKIEINNLTLGALAVVLADARPTTLLQKVSAKC